MTLIIKKEVKNEAMIWHLKGTMDITMTGAFNLRSDGLDRSINTIILDFSELEYIDSTGIGFLMQLINFAKGHFSKVVFQGLNDLNRDTFETIGILDLLKDIEEELV